MNKFRQEKFTYNKEEIDALKVYDSIENAKKADEKAGKKSIWYGENNPPKQVKS